MKKPITKKRHDAEVAAEADMITAIRHADHFMASLFRGAGEYEKRTAPTVLAAVKAGNEMAALARTTRRAIIYAIGADNRATMITMELIANLLALAKQANGGPNV